MKCSKCGAEILPNAKFCTNCGERVEAPKNRICSKCGEKLAEGVKFCTNCGTKVDNIEVIGAGKNDANEYTSSYNGIPSSSKNSFSYNKIPLAGEIPSDPQEIISSLEDKASVLISKFTNTRKDNAAKIIEKNRKTIVIVVLVVLFLIVFNIIALLGKGKKTDNTNVHKPQTTTVSKEASIPKIEVPGIEGLSPSEAKKSLTDAGFENIILDPVDVPENDESWVVRSQYPSAGSRAISDEPITVNCARKIKLYLRVQSNFNLLFDKYDLEIVLDDKEVGRIKNGEQLTILLDSLTGTHTLHAYKADSRDIEGSTEIQADNDLTFSVTVKHSGSSIEFTDVEATEGTESAFISVPDVTGKNLEEAVALLNKVGLNNVREEPYSEIYMKSNWIVDTQSVAAGETIGENDEIILNCSKQEAYTEEVNSEDRSQDTEDSTSEEEKAEDKSPGNENITIPTMSGASLDAAVNKLDGFGVTEVYDEDFGKGTRMKSFSDSAGGLMIDIIYADDTKEIMCASVTTNRQASEKEQKEFVKGISEAVCPSADKDAVSEWVASNVGKTDEKEINGFTYELSLGPVDNILYSAGRPEWENWESSEESETTDKENTQKTQKEQLEAKLDPITAWVAAERYGKRKYGSFTLHYIMGCLAEEPWDDDTWYLKADCDYTMFGDKLKGTCEAKVTGTEDNPQIVDFVVY